jgi:hypothetical protein
MERGDVMTTSTDSPAAVYGEQGFYIPPDPVFPAEIVEAAVEGMDAVRQGKSDTGLEPQPSNWNPGDDLNALCKMEQPQFASSAIRALINYPALGQWAARLTGAKWVQVWWVQLLYKPASAPGQATATNIGWHQDRHYWQAWQEGSELFTAWVALSDVGSDAGPMRFVPGSQQWGLIDEGGFAGQDLDALKSEIKLPSQAVWEEEPALLPPGYASFHDCYTYHGSGPNHSDGPRRSFAVHMRTDKSRPVEDKRAGLTRFIDDLELCPVIYGKEYFS